MTVGFTATLDYQGITITGGYIAISSYTCDLEIEPEDAPNGRITANLKYYKDKATHDADKGDNVPMPAKLGVNSITIPYDPATNPIVSITNVIETWFPDAVSA